MTSHPTLRQRGNLVNMTTTELKVRPLHHLHATSCRVATTRMRTPLPAILLAGMVLHPRHLVKCMIVTTGGPRPLGIVIHIPLPGPPLLRLHLEAEMILIEALPLGTFRSVFDS